MNIRELISAALITERQVRYLIAEGFIPAPRGGRSNADYGDDHLAAIRRYSRLRELGFPPAAIKLMLDAKEGVPFPISPGITITIEPDLLGSGTDPAPIIKAVQTLLTDILKENENEPRQPATKN